MVRNDLIREREEHCSGDPANHSRFELHTSILAPHLTRDPIVSNATHLDLPDQDAADPDNPQMAEIHLTRRQKRLRAELDMIFARIGLDYWDLDDTEPQWRTTRLEVIRREVIRGEVVSQYTLIDEQLGSAVSRYMFENEKFMKLWRTKRFERFNYFILEKMSLMEKLTFVKDAYTVPKAVASDIEAINAMRNALAHAYFPENLRAHRRKHGTSRRLVGPHYKGIDIFTIDGIDRFMEDASDVVQFLITGIRRKRQRSKSAAPALPSPVPTVD